MRVRILWSQLMPDRLSFGHKCKHQTHAPAANTAAIATVTGIAKGAGGDLHLVGYQFSASAAPAAAVDVTITGLEDGTLTIAVPAAAFAPVVVMLPRPLRVTPGTNLVGTLPALGGTTVGRMTLYYMPA
jgi:hypothetical protein